jgi:prefoldin subunit 5
MLVDSGALRDDTPPRNAAEAVQRLTQEAQSLATKLRQLTGSLQRSSSDSVSSTLQHLAVYDEAVQSLQVMIGQLGGADTELKTKRHFTHSRQLM